MKAESERFAAEDGNVIAGLLRAALLFIWDIVRVPIVIVLAFLEPFVRLLLSGIAVLSVLTGLVYKGSSVTPPIPFWVTCGNRLIMGAVWAYLQLRDPALLEQIGGYLNDTCMTLEPHSYELERQRNNRTHCLRVVAQPYSVAIRPNVRRSGSSNPLPSSDQRAN